MHPTLQTRIGSRGLYSRFARAGCSYTAPQLSYRAATRVVAVAAPNCEMKVYEAREMTEAQLQEFTARPRIDFESILQTVSLELPSPWRMVVYRPKCPPPATGGDAAAPAS